MNNLRKQRCLVLADAFVFGVEEMYLNQVYLRGKQRPFAFAGIWNKHFDVTSNETVHSFAIIKVPANKLMQQLGYPGIPVILKQEFESICISSTSQLSAVLSLLNTFPFNLINAYSIST